MESDFEKKLHQVRPKGLTPDEKSMLWANIGHSIEAEDYIKAHKKISGGPFNLFLYTRKARYIIAGALAGVLTLGSFGTVALADNSRPGDFLFPVELASENIRLRLTSPDNRDELRIQFASERLEEVKELLALANISFEELAATNIVEEAATTTATSSEETATSTDEVVDDSTDTTPENTSADAADEDEDETETATEDEDEQQEDENEEADEHEEETDKNTTTVASYDRQALTRANNAFLIALNYLEESRDDLVADGNDTAVLAIDAFIEELIILADNHVDDIEKARIVVGDGPNETDRVNIAIKASIDDVKTEFQFVEVKEEDGDLKRQKVVLDNGESELQLRVNESRTVIDIDNTVEDEDDHDETPHIHVCYKDKSLDLHYSDISTYLKKGATLGECEDDDDRDEERYYICYKGDTKYVNYNNKGHYLNKGAKLGKCTDDDDDDDSVVRVPACEFDPKDDRVIVKFDEKRIRSDKSQSNAYTNHENVDMDPGTYKVSLMSWDGYKGRENTSQPEESWYVVFRNDDHDTITTSGSVSDIPDQVREETVIEVVNDALVIDEEVDEVYAQHSAYKDTESANSVVAVCAAFDKVSDDDGRDHDAPTIDSLDADPSVTSVNVSWETDENATSKVWFSQNSGFDVNGSTDFVSSGTLKQNHLLTINGLSPETTYYYRAESEDGSGNVTLSDEESFTTEEESDTTPPIITGIAVNPTTTEAAAAWVTNEPTTGIIWYSEISPVDPSGASDAKESSALNTSHGVDIDGLSPQTTYYYIVVATDEEGNTATSTEDSFTTTSLPTDNIAPNISNVVSLSTTTEATITFSTDESASSVLWYGLISGNLGMSSSDGSLRTNHSYDLSGLTDDTIYYFRIVVADESGNTATSSEDSFTTTAVPVLVDSTPPVIGSVAASAGSTTASISFSTDEDATSKLFYSLTSPVDLGIATELANAIPDTTHDFNLSGLATSTTYYFVVTAEDDAGNETIESEDSFTTL